MFDIAPSEFLLTAIVAIVVIGPKDMPLALRTAGRWIGKMRRMSNHLRTGFDAMIREAEMEEMERKWREQNAAIMAAHPDVQPAEPVPHPAMLPLSMQHTPEQPTIEQPSIEQPSIEQPAIAAAAAAHPAPDAAAPAALAPPP